MSGDGAQRRGPRTVLAAADLVRWCFRETADPPLVRLADGDGDRLAAGLTHHRAWGVLHARRDAVSGVPQAVWDEATERNLATALAQLSLHADLRSAAASLSDAAVPWVVVKGPALAELVYPSPRHRHYNDLDLLVLPRDLRAAIAALASAGWELLDRNWALALDRMTGEVHLSGPHGTMLDLHWSLQNRDYRRARLRLDPDALFTRATTVSLGGVEARTLSWSDTVVHLALHAAGDGADRMVWLSDVSRVVARRTDPWSVLVARSREWGAGAATALVLARAVQELGTPVPSSVLGELGLGPVSRLVERGCHRRWPTAQVTAPYGPLAWWTQTRLEPASRLLTRLTRDRHTPFVESAANPQSLLHEAGGPLGLDRYLTAVETTDRRSTDVPDDRRRGRRPPPSDRHVVHRP